MNDFLSHISDAISDNQLFKLTLSKPKEKRAQLRNIYIKPIYIKDNLVWHATYRSTTQDQVKNYTHDEVIDLINSQLENNFYNADLYFTNEKISLLQTKKGRSRILRKKENHEIKIESHNHQKTRSIAEDAPYLSDLGLSSSNGKVYAHAQDKYKQINKYIEIIANLLKDDKSVNTIVDMGSGKGYLTFALYDYLTSQSTTDINMIGIEIREDLINKCNNIARTNGMTGLSFAQGSIDDYAIEKSDMVIALHACDIATDMAIAKGLEADAKYIIVAPCCHKQIRKEMTPTDSAITPILQYGILKERQAEMVTDSIRALLLESKGYRTNVFEFISSAHTGKNVMISAIKTGKPNKQALQQIKALKAEFGISTHYLETII